MISKQLDLNVSDSELNQAYQWWRSLSINQMKHYEKIHFPEMGCIVNKRYIHQMWEAENGCDPLRDVSSTKGD